MQTDSNPVQAALPAIPGEFLPSAPARVTVLDFDLSQPSAEMKAADPIVRETGNIVVKINPRKIRTSGVPNRCESAFGSEDFEALCLSVQISKGNEVPILVRATPGMAEDGTEFVLIYGERRLRACLLAGVDVLAIISSDQDKATEFLQMVRENVCRAALSPIELGQQAQYAIQNQLVCSLARLALEVGSSKSRISEAVRLAALPEEVLSAFTAPGELQFRDAKPLTDAVAADLAAMLAEIETIKTSVKTLSTKDIVSRLVNATGTGVRPSNAPRSTVLSCRGLPFGEMLFDKTGKIQILLDHPLEEKQRVAIVKNLESFYKNKVAKNSLGLAASAQIQP